MPRFLVHETAVHLIDTFRYLLGEPKAVYAELRRLNPAIAGEDAGHILFELRRRRARPVRRQPPHDHVADNPRRTMGEALIEGSRGTIDACAATARCICARFGESTRRGLLPPDTWEGFGGDCVHALQNHVVAHVLDGAALENTARTTLHVLGLRRGGLCLCRRTAAASIWWRRERGSQTAVQHPARRARIARADLLRRPAGRVGPSGKRTGRAAGHVAHPGARGRADAAAQGLVGAAPAQGRARSCRFRPTTCPRSTTC